MTTAEKLKKIDTAEPVQSGVDTPSMELEDLLPLAKIYAIRSFNKNSSYYEAAVMDVQDVESVAYIYTYLYLKKFKKSKPTRNVFCDDLVLHLLRLVHTLEVEHGKISQALNYSGELRCSLALNKIFTL